MSKVSLAGNASGTGIFTIASPNSNTDRTLTLPDSTGTLLNTASNTNFPAGSVLQVVQADYTTYTTTSTRLTASGITATITPKSATSQILILISMNGLQVQAANIAMHIELYVNGISVPYLDDFIGYGTNAVIGFSASYQYLHSPATTSATTYTVYYGPHVNGNVVTLNNYVSGNNRTRSGITLMEIAA